jgi:poly(A) polymerase
VNEVLLYSGCDIAQVGPSSLAQVSERAITPTVIPRDQHLISRANVSEGALKVLYRLKAAGYQAYLVGGCVRDLLLGREPKDFDVATDATPEQVKDLFRSCHLVGRRFRLAHVRVGPETVEVATFRARFEGEIGHEDQVLENGRILRDNIYGSIEEDAWRRDFTVNALYYNIRDFSVVDYVGGMDDLRTGTLRLIGDPDRRYREDPVRMLRAARFAARLGFRMHPSTEAPLAELGALLQAIAPARLFEEVLKMFLGGYAAETFELLRHYGLFSYLFALTEASLEHEDQGFPVTLVARALTNTDARVGVNKPVTPTFLFAALLWEPVRERAQAYQSREMNEVDALRLAADKVLALQAQRVAIPKRYALGVREIWSLQPRFRQRGGKRPKRLLAHPCFRAAYDFLLLRVEAGEEPDELGAWWTEFAGASDEQREALTRAEPAKPRRRRRPRRTLAP